jgi:tight adherence protein C
MTSVVYLMTMATVFLAVAIGSYALMPVRVRTLGGGLAIRRVEVARMPSVIFRLLFPLLDRLAPLFKRLTWPKYRTKAAVELQRAGLAEFMGVDHLLAAKVLSAVLTPLLVSQIFVIFANPLMFVLAGFGGFLLPDRLAADLRKARERKIVRTLPGAVDALSLSVEAGLEFLIAIQRLVERGRTGPLRDELATILNDIRLGKSRSEALKAFSARVEIPEVSSFVSVLVQADTLGASIGPVLQSQAERMRVERFQRAEKAGARASQKILFPLVLFIFPAVLIIIMGPVVLQMVYGR